jgi:hypothetical protein
MCTCLPIEGGGRQREDHRACSVTERLTPERTGSLAIAKGPESHRQPMWKLTNRPPSGSLTSDCF